MSIITVQSKTTSNWTSNSTLTVDKPSGTVDGDLLVAVICYDNAESMSTVPSGWTDMVNTTGASPVDTYTRFYYKVASSEGSSWDWVLSGAVVSAWVCLRIDGQKSTGYADQSAASLVTSNSNTPSYTITITPTAANSLIVYAVTGKNDTAASSAGYAVVTSDPTWTEQADLAATNGDGGRLLSVATANRPETSATGDASVTITSDNVNVIDTFGLIANFLPDTDETVSPDVINTEITVPAPTVTGGSNVTTSVINTTATVPAPTVTGSVSTVANQSKNAAANVDNLDKS